MLSSLEEKNMAPWQAKNLILSFAVAEAVVVDEKIEYPERFSTIFPVKQKTRCIYSKR